MKIEILNYEPLITLFISTTALILSFIALYYTIKSFLLKSGHKIKGDISTCSTIECDDNYVSSITLENAKDRATVIFTIYLKLARNNYLILEEFDENPLILKPFEVYHKKYEPIIFYSVDLKKVNLNKLLNNDKISRKIVLSTTDGKYTVKAYTNKWTPITLFFKNHFTAIIHPKRLIYDEVSYGSNVKFLVELNKSDSKKKVISLLENDYKIKKFTNFALTKESLKSVENLETFFKKLKEEGKISFDEIKIVDFKKQIENRLTDYQNEVIELEPKGLFKYDILGRIYTYRENKKIELQNRKHSK